MKVRERRRKRSEAPKVAEWEVGGWDKDQQVGGDLSTRRRYQPECASIVPILRALSAYRGLQFSNRAPRRDQRNS